MTPRETQINKRLKQAARDVLHEAHFGWSHQQPDRANAAVIRFLTFVETMGMYAAEIYAEDEERKGTA